MHVSQFFKQFNWRFLLVRVLVNATALAVTVLIVPRVYFVDPTILTWLGIAVLLGVLNALVKPVVQFITYPLFFATFGLVVVLSNAVMLWLLSFLFPSLFAVESLLWVLVGGVVLGLVSSFLESLLGLSVPIVDEPAQLRQQLKEQARHVDWIAAAGETDELHEHVPSPEPLLAESASPMNEPEVGEGELLQPATSEPGTLDSPPLDAKDEPAAGDTPAGEGNPSPPKEDGSEMSRPADASAAGTATGEGAEPARNPPRRTSHEADEA